jgi:hypothetical protein
VQSPTAVAAAVAAAVAVVVAISLGIMYSGSRPSCSAAGCVLERQTLKPGFHLIGYRLWV